MRSVTLSSPAKINLLLAITGVREDSFHDLVSVVAPIEFGDELTVTLDPQEEVDTLACNFPGVPTDGSNLALRAVAAYRQRAAIEGGVAINLRKQIPAGAGLGGGSSNASIVLLALQQLMGNPLTDSELQEVAASLGSDCPLFLGGRPVIMRGRGERLETLAPEAERRLVGQRLMVFKPDFGVETGWAYGRMKAHGGWYRRVGEIESILADWQSSANDNPFPLINNMQEAAFEKFAALPTLLGLIRQRHGLPCLMSGSGSACFALVGEDDDVGALRETIKSSLGPDCFCVESRIGNPRH